jgi:hypothetical protein
MSHNFKTINACMHAMTILNIQNKISSYGRDDRVQLTRKQ